MLHAGLTDWIQALSAFVSAAFAGLVCWVYWQQRNLMKQANKTQAEVAAISKGMLEETQLSRHERRRVVLRPRFLGVRYSRPGGSGPITVEGRWEITNLGPGIAIGATAVDKLGTSELENLVPNVPPLEPFGKATAFIEAAQAARVIEWFQSRYALWGSIHKYVEASQYDGPTLWLLVIANPNTRESARTAASSEGDYNFG